jgi:hypothetical protein
MFDLISIPYQRVVCQGRFVQFSVENKGLMTHNMSDNLI